MPYATALALTEEGFDTRLSQNAAKFHGGRYVVPPRRTAPASSTPEECAPIAELVAAGARVVLLRNHGVLVVGETVARAWWDLYFFERACMVQVLGGSSGERLAPMPDDVAHRAADAVRGGARRRAAHVGRGAPPARPRAARLRRADAPRPSGLQVSP